MGQAGAYIIHDPAEDALNLPSGYGTYDIPLILSSKQYNADGTLFSTNGETDSLWGDVIHVNGQPWPFLNVQPRKYRLRFLDAAISRSFALYFAKSTATGTKLPFQVIASDAGLMTEPVSTNQLVSLCQGRRNNHFQFEAPLTPDYRRLTPSQFISMAERYEVVFDFTPFAGQSIDLRNLEKVGGVGTDEDYTDTDKLMRFNVAGGTAADPSAVPATLRAVPFPPESTGVDHHFRFHRSSGEWQINGVTFSDAANRVLANVPRGKVEIWELENGSGGWTHPIHVHLVDFRVIRRTGGDRQAVLPYEGKGLKDVVWLAKNEQVTVEAHYAPWDGLYMFHCHNLIHEDHDMMGAFNVTQLEGFGYNQDIFLDPMENEWRPKPFALADYQGRTGPFSDAAITARVQAMAQADPYSKVDLVEGALDEYWATHSKDKRAGGQIPRYRKRDQQ
jgi:bilirubin oxidase